jgi:hypothetical protein
MSLCGNGARQRPPLGADVPRTPRRVRGALVRLQGLHGLAEVEEQHRAEYPSFREVIRHRETGR